MHPIGRLRCADEAATVVAVHITRENLPDYAPGFPLSRYEDLAYQSMLATLEKSSGQL